MGYINNSDIEVRVGAAAYVQFADDDGDAVADAAVVNEVRGAAEGEVNSYLAARYQTPVDVVLHPELLDLLKSVTLDIAEYRLRARRPPVSDEATRRYRQTIEWLAHISQGVLALPSLSEVQAPSNRGLLAASAGEARLLTRDELAAH
jgi:phage gp36-like protein